jgi:YidC/Oxa1 family membrane protein insertase
MFDRKTIIAMILVGLILILLPKYYRLISPQRPGAPEPVSAPVDTTAKPAREQDTATEQPPVTASPLAAPLPSHPQAVPADTLPNDPQCVRIETKKFSMTIGQDAQITSYILKEYVFEGGAQVFLHAPANNPAPPSCYLDFDLGQLNFRSLNNIRFTPSARALNIASGVDSVTLTVTDSTGRLIALTYVFDADKYGFGVRLQTKGLNVPETGEFRIRWIGGVPSTEPDAMRDVQYSGAYALVGDALEKVTTGRERTKEFTATGQTRFAAVRSKYFMAAIVPAEPAAGVEIHGTNTEPRSRASAPQYDLTLRQPWGANASGEWTIYWGPIRYDNLKALNVGLEGTMNWGWAIIKPFSMGVLRALIAVHKAIPNYGFVIIIFSLAVKIVLWPLTRKSQVSMKKMAALQPEIQTLREQHSKNPQAMNQAIMALYKERGVNPASGCIPLLLQMPLLYALFVVFSSTIEFRQAPFILWIKDLSLPDYVYTLPFAIPMYGARVAVLPLVMAVTQFFMSKRTTTDPNQKFMLYIMPIFMLMIFNNLPSGLTFYYTLFNLLAIVEQNLIKLPDFTPSVQVVEEKKGKKRG